MKTRAPSLLVTVSMLAALAVLTTSGCAAWRLQQAAQLARQSEPFQASPPGASGRLLVVGDSTAVGTGASAPAASLVGLIGRAHPQLEIVNRGSDGARYADIVRQLQPQEGAGGRFDAILVLGGGNDVIRLTSAAVLEENIVQAAALARIQAPLVVFLPSGNVGNAPFFFPPWSWLMTQRSRTLHALVRESAADNSALYVNLFKDKAEDPFAQRPEELNASDGLHPSDAGYELWLTELNRQADLSRRLDALRP